MTFGQSSQSPLKSKFVPMIRNVQVVQYDNFDVTNMI